MLVAQDSDTEQLIKAFAEDLYAILEGFIEETQDAKIVIGKIESEISQLKSDLGYLNKVIRDGNGQPPIMTRIALLEKEVLDTKEELAKAEEAEETSKKIRWEIFVAAVPGLLALIASLMGGL